MSLHDRIMKLPKRTPGQLDTVKNAARMAQEADELMDQMALTLDYLADEPFNSGAAAVMLRRYNKWKEQTK